MINFNITKAPPTEVEVKTHLKSLKVARLYFLCSFAVSASLFFFSCFLLANFFFVKINDIVMSLMNFFPSLKEFGFIAINEIATFSVIISLMQLLTSLLFKQEIKKFGAISKDKCEILLKLCNDNEIKVYCKEVAAQGRQITEAEYDAIILLQTNKLKSEKNIQQELAS